MLILKRLFQVFIFFVFSQLLVASDNTNNVIFENLNYPIEIKTNQGEKDNFIIYETPYSLISKYEFNTIMIQGETEDLNISPEIWVKDAYYPENKYILKANIFKIYKNGRFWAKFILKNNTKNPIKLIIRNTLPTKTFKLVIYEIQSFKVPVTKPEITESTFVYIPDPEFSLPQNIPFHLIRRNEWQSMPPKEPYTKHTPMAITIHHTAGKYPETIEQSFEEIQFIQDYHQNGRGWIDIGYHFLIDPLGNIFEGRPLKVVGAHVLGKNTNNIGISIMGFYHSPKDNQVSTNTIAAIITLSKYLSENYTITKSSFYAHRELGSTDCPGDILYSHMPDFRKLIFEENEPIGIKIENIQIEIPANFQKPLLIDKLKEKIKQPKSFFE